MKPVRAVIDRFEEGYAVLLCGDKEIRVDMPRELLPSTAGEGDILEMSLEIDREGTRRQQDKIGRLLQKLKDKNNPDPDA